MKVSNIEKIEFLKRAFKNSRVDSKSENVSIWCPYCRNKNINKLKLFIHVEKGFYHCWICDTKGSSIHKLIRKVSPNYAAEAKKIYVVKEKQKFDLNIDLSALYEDVNEVKEEVDVLNEFPSHFDLLSNAFNSRDPDIRDIFSYALKRGFNKHKLFMLRAGYSKDTAYRRFLIIPSIDSKGDLNFFTSRKIDANTSDSYKYKNSKVSKKNIIFNEVNIDWTKELVLVEGPLDLIKTPDNATCLLGSSLTEDMLLFKKISKNRTPIVLALDADAYGKTIKIAKSMVAYGLDVKIADTRGAEDIGDMSREKVRQIVSEAKTYNLEDNLLNKIKSL